MHGDYIRTEWRMGPFEGLGTGPGGQRSLGERFFGFPQGTLKRTLTALWEVLQPIPSIRQVFPSSAKVTGYAQCVFFS